MTNLAATTAAALLEYDRLGRLSDKTRDELADQLDDVAAGRVVEVDDEHQGDDETETEKSGARKASGASKGASK